MSSQVDGDCDRGERTGVRDRGERTGAGTIRESLSPEWTLPTQSTPLPIPCSQSFSQWLPPRFNQEPQANRELIVS